MSTTIHEPYKVLICDDPHPVAAEIFETNGFDVTQVKKLPKTDLIACIGEYDALLVRGSEIKDEAIFANAGKLKAIGRAGTGYDNIDRKLATAHRVVVMNAPDGNAPAAAELTLCHMLNLARQMTLANANVHAGTWSRTAHQNDFQLRGKTLGIIGCGRIGSRVAAHAQSFGMEVIVYDPYILEGKVEALGGKRIKDLNALLQTSDIVTLHADLNDETRQIINDETLAMCKKGVYIVNCARGEMIDARALADALRSGHVANAALDVITDEPVKGNADLWKANPLIGIDRVAFTPHLGGTTKESLRDVASQAAEQIVDYLCKGVIMNAVNEPYLETNVVCAQAHGHMVARCARQM
ncbi:MAG: hydroxyacid dehydrogenase [Alphaproteobacteria bacterium]|nr:hydroxyacid dehydrogenase [Alphaproteobacteria bacterium]